MGKRSNIFRGALDTQSLYYKVIQSYNVLIDPLSKEQSQMFVHVFKRLRHLVNTRRVCTWRGLNFCHNVLNYFIRPQLTQLFFKLPVKLNSFFNIFVTLGGHSTQIKEGSHLEQLWVSKKFPFFIVHAGFHRPEGENEGFGFPRLQGVTGVMTVESLDPV